MSELVIREATLNDEAELLRMMRLLAARATFRRFLSLPAFGRAWLLYQGNLPIGYIVLTIGFSFEFHGHDAFIDELYIEAAFRCRGFGRQAITFAEKKAREMGVNAIHLEVDRGK